MRRAWENLPLRVKTLLVVAVPTVPLLVAIVMILLSARRERDAERWVAHTLEVKAQLEATQQMTADANAAVQAFLLTHQADSLKGFIELGQKWPDTTRRLIDLVRDNPAQVDRLKQMRALQGRNPLATLVRYAAAHPSEPFPVALLVANEQTINAFRSILGSMQRVEDDLLQARVSAQRQAEQQQEWLMLGGAMLGVLGTIATAFMFSQGFVRRIERVGENADRLSRGEDLLPFTGERRDELGQLAGRIRTASALLSAREAELKVKVAELGAVNTELEAFSYSVSHDLRAPLRHITGFVSLLKGTAADRLDAEDSRMLKTIADAAARMGRLIDDLLSFSRMGRSALARRRVRLADLVADARKEVAVHGSDAAATWTIHSLPEADVDPSMMHLVFVNLIGNALKYAKPGEQPSVEIGVNGHEPGETVVFVRDKGVGFDMQYAHKLFGVFQRLHSAEEFEGTGIGLANVRRIIHRHGGRVWAEGAVNAGATFYFSLPDGETAL